VVNKCFEDVDVDGEIIAILDTEKKEIQGGIFWVDLENEDEAILFSEQANQAEGSVRYCGPRNNGFLFEVE